MTLSLSKTILDYLTAQGAKRERVGERAISASNSGSCPRQVSYLIHRPELASGLEAQVMARFELGHSVHESMAKILEKAGLAIHAVEMPVSFTVASHPTRSIPGHTDIVVKEGGSLVPVEIKSCGAWEFKVLTGMKTPSDPGDGRISWAHQAQNLAYQKALGSPHGYMLYQCVEKDKEAQTFPTFPFYDVEIPWTPILWDRVEAHWKAVLDSTADVMPERPYGPIEETVRFKKSGRWVLPFPCNYCGFVGDCWPEAKLDPDGPRAKTYVVPEPVVKATKADVF